MSSAVEFTSGRYGRKVNRMELRFRGQGGQGSITMGYIFGRAASIYEGKNSMLSEAYGPEIKGGYARADVVIQVEDLNYPLVDNPEILVVLSQEAWQAEKNNVREDGIVIYESQVVHPEKIEGDKRKYYGVPALEMALELKNRVVMNVIMMAVTQELTNAVSKESLEKALLDRIPPRFKDLNLSALKVGYEFAQKIKEGHA
ncbi:MAG: 2-oxoacid:acceptor oxidoreductase family protein [Candidatus Heimdallarchaeota archaeon]|nr:2-oxoacid:acceptor oxidoreductase family protein [Candidatus Heimdallarchaeota archaeon]